MTEEDRALFTQAKLALIDARRLWPARHPASGLIVGIEEDCAKTYECIQRAIEALQVRLYAPVDPGDDD